MDYREAKEIIRSYYEDGKETAIDFYSEDAVEEAFNQDELDEKRKVYYEDYEY
jgi:hypothetical protein